jgi:hypothetical protein
MKRERLIKIIGITLAIGVLPVIVASALLATQPPAPTEPGAWGTTMSCYYNDGRNPATFEFKTYAAAKAAAEVPAISKTGFCSIYKIGRDVPEGLTKAQVEQIK